MRFGVVLERYTMNTIQYYIRHRQELNYTIHFTMVFVRVLAMCKVPVLYHSLKTVYDAMRLVSICIYAIIYV